MNGTRVLALAIVGAFLMLVAPLGSAQAASLINPGAAAAVQQGAKENITTEVRWHHHGYHHHWHHHHWHHHHWHHHWHYRHWHHRWHHHYWHHRWHHHHWHHRWHHHHR